MKKIILVISLLTLGANSLFAQENENLKAVKEMEKKGFFGNFNYRYDDIHTINVNYSITPRIPTDKVNFTLHTPEARPLSIAIVNNEGVKVRSWTPDVQHYILEGSLDVTTLPKGKYAYIILWDNKEAYRIAFEK